MLNDLFAISESPDFPDRMRNSAGEVYQFIRHYEPEPEKPLIVKSGNTFVAYDKGIDYLCVKPIYWVKILKDDVDFKPVEGFFDDAVYWDPFSEIELTDEIALLRPIVKMGNFPCTLYGVIKNAEYPYLLYFKDNTFGTYENCRLATAKELS